MKIVFEKLSDKPQRKAKVVHRIARTMDGKRVTVRVLNADSATFETDFLSAFNANVRRARRENKAIAQAK